MLKRLVGFVGISLLGITVIWGGLTIWSFNAFEDVASKFNGKCQAVTGIAGPEDLQFDFSSRKAFISSYDRRGARANAVDDMRGAIYLFDILNPLDGTSWKDRTGGIPEKFEPHGLYFYTDAKVRRLFVVNGSSNAIELFDVTDNGDLIHLESFTERRLTSPKDIIATGPRSFYVTNDRNAGRSSLRGQIDFLLRRRTGVIFFYNGTSWHRAADNIRYANGLAISNGGKKLYVAETAGGNLLEYDREAQTGYLRYARKIGVGDAVDNINIDEDGILWIGAHPQPLALARHRRDAGNFAPSKVYSFDPESDILKTVYSDDGSSLSGSSSAARLQRKLIIGALYEEKFLICDLAEE